ncbi:hypothetical protein [Listeria costaricensis]|uniref:hypothetical protein n=1 Tax=Listeria costaricensis TaxID=2026604 RepID=UPI000C07A571|nr:hypothetical protein [Listeria costaricensis]
MKEKYIVISLGFLNLIILLLLVFFDIIANKNFMVSVVVTGCLILILIISTIWSIMKSLSQSLNRLTLFIIYGSIFTNIAFTMMLAFYYFAGKPF